jgi:hypothetical protein
MRFVVSDDRDHTDKFTFGSSNGTTYSSGATLYTDGCFYTDGLIFAKGGYSYASSWTGTVNHGQTVTVNHNLGYIPLVTFKGNTGNINLSYAASTNTLVLYVYNTGNNPWTGTVYLW